MALQVCLFDRFCPQRHEEIEGNAKKDQPVSPNWCVECFIVCQSVWLQMEHYACLSGIDLAWKLIAHFSTSAVGTLLSAIIAYSEIDDSLFFWGFSSLPLPLNASSFRKDIELLERHRRCIFYEGQGHFQKRVSKSKHLPLVDATVEWPKMAKA